MGDGRGARHRVVRGHVDRARRGSAPGRGQSGATLVAGAAGGDVHGDQAARGRCGSARWTTMIALSTACRDSAGTTTRGSCTRYRIDPRCIDCAHGSKRVGSPACSWLGKRRLLDEQGRPLRGSRSDSEGLAVRNGRNQRSGDSTLLVSFERHPRILEFSPDGTLGKTHSLPTPFGRSLAAMHRATACSRRSRSARISGC